MVIAETEEVITAQREGEHKNILDMIALLDKRLSKIENDDKGTTRNAIGDKALLMKLTTDIESNRIKSNENRARLYTIEYNIKDIDSCLESIQVILARIGKHVDKDVLYKEEDNNGKD